MIITLLIFLMAVTFFEYTQGIDPTNFRILTIIMLYISIMKKWFAKGFGNSIFPLYLYVINLIKKVMEEYFDYPVWFDRSF